MKARVYLFLVDISFLSSHFCVCSACCPCALSFTIVPNLALFTHPLLSFRSRTKLPRASTHTLPQFPSANPRQEGRRVVGAQAATLTACCRLRSARRHRHHHPPAPRLRRSLGPRPARPLRPPPPPPPPSLSRPGYLFGWSVDWVSVSCLNEHTCPPIHIGGRVDPCVCAHHLPHELSALVDEGLLRYGVVQPEQAASSRLFFWVCMCVSAEDIVR